MANVMTAHQEWQGPIGWAHGSQASGVPKEALFGCFAPLAHTWLLLSLFCDDGVGEGVFLTQERPSVNPKH